MANFSSANKSDHPLVNLTRLDIDIAICRFGNAQLSCKVQQGAYSGSLGESKFVYTGKRHFGLQMPLRRWCMAIHKQCCIYTCRNTKGFRCTSYPVSLCQSKPLSLSSSRAPFLVCTLVLFASEILYRVGKHRRWT